MYVHELPLGALPAGTQHDAPAPPGRGRPPGDTCPPEVQARLGVESDRAISRDLAVPLATVRGWRIRRGIPAVQRPAAREKAPSRPRGRPPGDPEQSRHKGPTVHLSAVEAAAIDAHALPGESRADTVARLAGVTHG